MVQFENKKLILKYIPISQVVLWDNNPKTHDIGAIVESIVTYGFQDPPKFDSGLGGLIEGNGRTTALYMMMQQNYKIPNGIFCSSDSSEWLVPIIFGNDLSSKEIAQRYAIDHNNISLMGGDGITALDISKLWDREKYISLLLDIGPTVSNDQDDINLLLSLSSSNKIKPSTFENTPTKDNPPIKKYSLLVYDLSLAELEMVELQLSIYKTVRKS